MKLFVVTLVIKSASKTKKFYDHTIQYQSRQLRTKQQWYTNLAINPLAEQHYANNIKRHTHQSLQYFIYASEVYEEHSLWS